jgi:3-oxoacyl-[acyl-carrier-protein] synthase II
VSCRVVITGAGLISSLGSSPRLFWERLMAGASGIATLTRFPNERFACRLAAQVDDRELPPVAGPYAHELKRMDRFVRYAVAAAGSALEESRILESSSDGGAVFIGVGMGGLPNMEAGVVRQDSRGPRKITPYLIPSLIPNMAASMTVLANGLDVPQYTIAGACASGLQALGLAMLQIRGGGLRWALAGGTEGVVTPIAFSGFEALKVLSISATAAGTPRPFDAAADGMIVGEGSAVFVLEERSHAEARGVPILGELSGFATSTGTDQIALQSAPAMAKSMRGALHDAGMTPHDVDCVYSHGSGVPLGDACELEAVRTIFGNNGGSPTITSIKGHIGHTFAASGPLNLAAALSALRNQTVSPLLNFRAAAQEFAHLDLAAHPRERSLRSVMINAVGFGGINASLLVSGERTVS